MSRHEVECEVTGVVGTVEVSVGDTVAEGDVLFIVESMKMQIPVEVAEAGTVAEILVQPGDSVEEDQLIAVIES